MLPSYPFIRDFIVPSSAQPLLCRWHCLLPVVIPHRHRPASVTVFFAVRDFVCAEIKWTTCRHIHTTRVCLCRCVSVFGMWIKLEYICPASNERYFRTSSFLHTFEPRECSGVCVSGIVCGAVLLCAVGCGALICTQWAVGLTSPLFGAACPCAHQHTRITRFS